MIYIDLPTGDGWGWGVCGDNLAKALATLTPIERLAKTAESFPPLAGPLIESVGPDFRPARSGLVAKYRVGYTFFEEDVTAQRAASAARGAVDIIATGCHWCEDVLRQVGLTCVATIHQGVDTSRFHPRRAIRQSSEDRFVVFSGGKFELRKSQDIVVRAFHAFSERHPDAILVAAWHNPFRWSAATMGASPYYPFTSFRGEPFGDSVRRWLTTTGVDLRRIELVPPVPNDDLATIYLNSDVGLFPNRCEGGTNLVLMEYMACGRAAIATDFSGHSDVVTDANCLPLRGHRRRPIVRDGALVANWCEPNIDEIVERLETAYRNRQQLSNLGVQAAADLSAWTWERTARGFLALLQNQAGQPLLRHWRNISEPK